MAARFPGSTAEIPCTRVSEVAMEAAWPLADLPAMLFRGWRDLLFPPACAWCLKPLDHGIQPLLCGDCTASLPRLDAARACRRCGMPLPHWGGVSLAAACPECRERRFPFSRVIAWGPYHGALKDLVRRLKCGRQDALAAAAGHLLADLAAHADGAPPDIVTAVPRHWRRRLVRGDSISGILAGAVSRRLNAPLRLRWLRCGRATRKQGTLSPAQRAANVRGAFRCRRRLRLDGARLLLVDDVLTSGATASAAARCLLQAGAGEVQVAVLARALGK